MDDVRQALETGDTIEEYPEDVPYPSRLVLGRAKDRAVHVVAADNREDQEIIIVTAYEPDPAQWDADFKRRTT